MAATYQAFLAAPSAAALAPNASINYINTTTAVHEPAAIIKHLQIHQKQVVKKDEKILHTIESGNGLCLETEVTLQFHNGGGAFLPGMDENVIDERIVTFPLVHVVSFDPNGKICQMRLYWDQGTLLKQVEAIGRTGRNWPIREGQKLVEAVKTSVNTSGQASNGSAGRAAHSQHDVVVNQHKRGESVNPTRDPHASLALFAPRDPSEDAGSTYDGPKVATRPSAKPAPRDYGELFVSEESAGNYRSDSPAKIDGRAVKAGAGKHVSDNRLFDEDSQDAMNTPQGKKTYQQKYDHFAFGNGEDAKHNKPSSSRSNRKSEATFSFEDFATPPKVTEKNKPDYDRHWGADYEDEKPNTKENTRPSARSENEPSSESPAPRKIYNTAGDGMGGRKGAYNPIIGETENRAIYVTAGDGMGGRKGGYNPILGETEKKIYTTAGDGTGNRKGGRSWGIGDESDPEVESERRSSGRNRRGQASPGAGY